MSDRLPFSRWDIEPYVDESITGYFQRLVAHEQHSSTRTYAMALGLTDRASATDEVLAIVLSLPMNDEWKARLRHSAALAEGDNWLLGGEMFAQRQIGISRKRVCRACLHEARYDRAWWSIMAIERCPFHDLPIATPRIRWFHWWTHIEEDEDGEALAQPAPRLDPERRSFAGYLLGRMGFGPRLEAPILDGMSMQDAVDTWRVATFLRDTEKRVRDPLKPGFDEGFDLVSGTRVDAIEKLRIWLLAEYPVDVLAKGIDACFKTLRFKQIRVPMSPELSGWFTDIMRRAHIAAVMPGHGPMTEQDADATHTTLRGLAKQLEVGAKAASYAAKRLDFLPDKSKYKGCIWFSASQVEEIKDYLNSFVSYAEAGKMLGLGRYQLKPLVDAGLLESFGNARIAVGRHRNVHKRDIERLLKTKVDVLPEIGKQQSWSLVTASRSWGVEPGYLAATALAGKLECVGRLRGTRDLGGLRFRRDHEVPAAFSHRPRPQRELVGHRSRNHRRVLVRKALADGVDEVIRIYGIRRSTLELWIDASRQGGDALYQRFPHAFIISLPTPTSLKSRALEIARNEGIGAVKIALRLKSEGSSVHKTVIDNWLRHTGLGPRRQRRASGASSQ